MPQTAGLQSRPDTRDVSGSQFEMQPASSKYIRKDVCILRQVGIRHKCSEGCGLLEDGGLDNLDGSSREKTQRYYVVASEDAGAPACDVLSTIAIAKRAFFFYRVANFNALGSDVLS